MFIKMTLNRPFYSLLLFVSFFLLIKNDSSAQAIVSLNPAFPNGDDAVTKEMLD
jgi:hypothetical protein